jgi:hypothetical protein
MMDLQRASAVLLMAAGTLVGCSFNKSQEPAAADPNVLPTNYRTQIASFLRQSLTHRADFRGAMISEPAMKPVGGSAHYIVCVQFSPRSPIKTKAAVYLAGQMTQFIDATPEQCADAVFTPFKELDAAVPAA